MASIESMYTQSTQAAEVGPISVIWNPVIVW